MRAAQVSRVRRRKGSSSGSGARAPAAGGSAAEAQRRAAARRLPREALEYFSAGPNGQAETVFNQAYKPGGAYPTGNYGWLTAGDDEAAVLSAMGPF